LLLLRTQGIHPVRQERRIEKVIVAASVDELLDPDLMPPNKPLLPTVRAAERSEAARTAADRQGVRQAGILPGETAPAGRPGDGVTMNPAPDGRTRVAPARSISRWLPRSGRCKIL
jgi:hypothetical protein